MNKKIILLLLVFIADATFMSAQDTNEFQRIARRIMNAYDVGDELEHAPDSANFYGGAYLGAGTNGHTMPSAYVTYLKKEKLLITGQLAIDISKLNTEKDVTTDYHTGADRLTHSDILTKSEKQDFSIRLDYSPSKPHILTFGIIESLKNASGDDAKIVPIDATGLSLETGTTKATNIVMLGALSNYLGVDENIWKEAIEEAFAAKPKTIPGNIAAFEKGREAGA